MYIPDANYAVFTGLTATEVILTADVHPILIKGPGSIAGFQIIPGGRGMPPHMGVHMPRDGTLVISWSDGVLQSSTNLPTGAWMDIPGAHSPYTVDGHGGLSLENFRIVK